MTAPSRAPAASSPRPSAVRTGALLCALLLPGCRDGAPPFTPTERTSEGPPHALTFGYGNDADPRWSPGGDTLLYHTNVFGTLPQARGVLLGIDADGGVATPVFLAAQNTVVRPLATPAPSPAGDLIAYMDLLSVDSPGACAPIVPCVGIQPLLDSAMLRVRGVDELRPITQDPSVAVRFAGTDPQHRIAGDGPYVERLFPFQERHRTEAAMLFRPSWSPDGQRITFSDGLSIRIWQVGAAATTVIPGTADGVSAAWSPDGEWIAFTVLARADSQVVNCACGSSNPPVPATRWIYSVAEPVLVVVRPDGTDRREIGAGEDPAWSPDNQHIYARRDDMIVRVPAQGGAAVVITNTDRGRSPAVSPDGTRLAFARRKNQVTVDYDIWIVSLAQ